MARYIDADKLKKRLKEYCIDGDKVALEWYDIMGIDEAIDNLPTEDVEPTRHGKWIENDNVTYRLYVANNGESYCKEIIYPFVCSECSGGSEYKSRYCMDCGAKMDKEGEQ